MLFWTLPSEVIDMIFTFHDYYKMLYKKVIYEMKWHIFSKYKSIFLCDKYSFYNIYLKNNRLPYCHKISLSKYVLDFTKSNSDRVELKEFKPSHKNKYIIKQLQ